MGVVRWGGNMSGAVLDFGVSSGGALIQPLDSSFPIDLRFLSVSPDGDAGVRGRDLFEVVYVSAGTGELLIQQRRLPARQGDLIVIGSSLGHSLHNRAGSPLTLASLLFHPDLIRGASGEEGAEYLTPFLEQDEGFPHVVRRQTGTPAEVFDLMGRIRGELPAAGLRARLAVRTYLKMALMLLVNHFASYSGTAERSQWRQKRVERLGPLYRYLEAHSGEAVKVKDAARICAMSESHFMAFFRAATGQSFVAYLNRSRIERAQSWLASSDRPVSEIGQALGFCDQSYFSAVFRKLTGLPPAAYRKRFQFGGAESVLEADTRRRGEFKRKGTDFRLGM
jgi:AraC-like DNA-binding protein